MAATLTKDGELTYLSFPIIKAEQTADGDVLVYGKATDGSLDSDEQIIDPEFAAKAVQDWLGDGANIRVQHNAQRDPAGVGIEADTDGLGATWVKGRIIEPVAQKLVLGGALRAYSVGIARPTIVRDAGARGGRITGGKVVEISLVDRPANKNCSIQLVKAAKDGAPKLTGVLEGDDAFIQKALMLVKDDDEKPTEIIVHGDGDKDHDGDGLFDADGDGDGAVAVRADDDDDNKSSKMISISLPEDVSIAFTPSDLARVLAKNSKDSNVGEDAHSGGVDRSQIPDEDFAGRNRSFPVTSPGDVSDAAQSIGRAGDDNYSSDQLKANIKRIAHRKGPEYVAQLPDSWKSEDQDDTTEKAEGTSCSLCHGTGKIREGNVKCPRCHGDGKTSAGEPDEHGDTAEKSDSPMASGTRDENEERAKHDNDDDDESSDDDDDDDDDDSAEKAEDADAVKGRKCGLCKGTGKIREGHVKCPKCQGAGTVGGADDDDDDDDNAEKAFKPGKMACKCGAMVKSKHKFCPSCGAALADGQGGDSNEPEKTGTKKRLKKALQKAEGDTPGDGVKGHHTEGMPSHREPDGAEVEAFEDDAKMQDGDEHTSDAQPTHLEAPTLKSDAPHAALARVLTSGAPSSLGILHDFTCSAFHPEHVAKCYPQRSLGYEIDTSYWQQKALDLAATLPFPQAMHAAQLGHAAVALKEASPALIWETQDELNKAFSDANPGPGSAPTPASITPGAYNRPYISAGHAAPSTAHSGPNTTPIMSGSIQAAQYDRPALTAGHEAPSPGNGPAMSQAVGSAIDNAVSVNSAMAAMHSTSGSSVPGSVPGMPHVASLGAVSGAPNVSKGARTFYSNSSKEQTKQAMRTLHDHIASAFPDLCPMKSDEPTQKHVAQPQRIEADYGTVPRQLTKAEKKAEKKRAAQEREAAFAQAALPQPEVTKSIDAGMPTDASNLESVLASMQAQLAAQTELITKQQKQLKKQKKQLDEIGSQPDPSVVPYRGVAMAPLPGQLAAIAKMQQTSGSAGMAAPGHMANVAERTQAMMLAELEHEYRTQPDPALREAAWRSIVKMRGVGNI